MPIEIFRASVQYGDLHGKLKADRADRRGPGEWLVSEGLIERDGFVVGINMDIRENRDKFQDPVYVDFLVIEGSSFDHAERLITSSEEPIEVKKVSVEMDIKDFLSLFKRFNVALSPKGMLDNKEYRYSE